MPCILLFRIIVIVLVYCGAPSPTVHALDTALSHTCGFLTQYNQHVQRYNLSYHHSVPGLTSTVPAPHHTHLHIMP